MYSNIYTLGMFPVTNETRVLFDATICLLNSLRSLMILVIVGYRKDEIGMLQLLNCTNCKILVL